MAADTLTALLASMGPRHFSRGKDLSNGVGSIVRTLLQWGHGISAVES